MDRGFRNKKQLPAQLFPCTESALFCLFFCYLFIYFLSWNRKISLFRNIWTQRENYSIYLTPQTCCSELLLHLIFFDWLALIVAKQNRTGFDHYNVYTVECEGGIQQDDDLTTTTREEKEGIICFKMF